MILPRIYAILDADSLARRGLGLTCAAAAMVRGGCGLLQLRVKGSWTRAQFEEARNIARLCREEGATLIINDRADIAALLEAGMHLGQDDLPPRDARRIVGPDAILGFSTHNARQLAEAGGEPVDYVALGPIFGTASKQNPDPVVGLEQLREWRGLIDKPLVAIGGITRERVREVFDAGADSVALIGDLLPEPCTARGMRERMEEWQRIGK